MKAWFCKSEGKSYLVFTYPKFDIESKRYIFPKASAIVLTKTPQRWQEVWEQKLQPLEVELMLFSDVADTKKKARHYKSILKDIVSMLQDEEEEKDVFFDENVINNY